MRVKDKPAVKILLADPNDTSRNVIAIMLHKLGYSSVFEAMDEAEAGEVISKFARDNSGMASLLGGAAARESVDLDLVILDCELPPASGVSWLLKIRERFGPDRLPVLFVTMKGKECDVAAAADAGANYTMVKPFSRDALAAALDNLLTAGRAPVIKSFSFTGGGADKKTPPERNGKPAEGFSPPSPPPPAEPPAAPSSNALARSSGGASFHSSRRGASYSTDGPPTAELVDGKIDGHYHEKVDVIGGGVNCYWARRAEGEDVVHLEYLSPKGKPTGMAARDVPLERFMHTFYLCDEGSCPILARLAEERNAGRS